MLVFMASVIAGFGLRKPVPVGWTMVFDGVPVARLTPVGLCGRSDGLVADKPVI